MRTLYHLECIFKKVRHSALLKHVGPLWDMVRPLYDRMLKVVGRRGLVRKINGTDLVLLCPECRGVDEIYEPEIWALAMAQLRPGARVLDIGAHVGLYAVAFGRRVGPAGLVLAVEPDPENLVLLHRHIELNRLKDVVQVLPCGLADAPGAARLSMNSLQSHVASTGGSVQITLDTLDRVAGSQSWDLMLIDVEGFEEKVLRGAAKLLGDTKRRPSTIVIEVHPYNWPHADSSSASLLQLLRTHGYEVLALDGSPITDINRYGHIVARTK